MSTDAAPKPFSLGKAWLLFIMPGFGGWQAMEFLSTNHKNGREEQHPKDALSSLSWIHVLRLFRCILHYQPLPLALATARLLQPPIESEAEDTLPAHNEGLEDYDDDDQGRRRQIEISDAMIDENPFDPSWCDEEWYRHEQQLQQALHSQRGSPSQSSTRLSLSRHSSTGLLSRVFRGSPGSPGSSRSPRIGSGPPSVLASPTGGAGGSSAAPWRMNFRHRRGSTVDAPVAEEDEEDDHEGTAGGGGVGHDHNRRGNVQEPGVLLSGTSPKKWGLVPLAEAQGRSDIVRRAEGFEMQQGSSSRR
ncbi:hypothetical protein BC835DRAFT_1424073 [Cytidiella melzeri]|nr:hypothetical protein BC835DRAFT_1424073 [Cytidiella melzeri]